MQARNATADVKDVTSIVEEAYLKVYESLWIGLTRNAGIVRAVFQASWNTKTSSEPIPTIIIMID